MRRRMNSKNVLYYGKEEPLPERIPLRAGPLTLSYEQGDLRYIKLGDREILRRIYVAIRDRNWSTILSSFSNIHMDIQADSFHITYEVENKRAEIDFTWKGEISGDAQGKITFSMQGLARSSFMRNRIGFCVLHPAACAGAAARVEHVDGQIESGSFPEIISADQPVQPFAELRSFAHQVSPGVWAEVSFMGDIFEMEDQRNWTDASYKTFCTPLRLTYPVQIETGTQIIQSVTLVIRDKRTTTAKGAALEILDRTQPVTFSLQSAKTYPLPHIGLGVASHGQPLNAIEIARLKALHLHHLRVDLLLSSADFPGLLDLAAAQAKALGVSLEVALVLDDHPKEGLARLRQAVERIMPPVTTWLVYPVKEIFKGGSPTHQVVEAARKHLSGLIPGARFGAGTNTDLIFMQRTPPPLDLLDFVTFAINPQVHAFDDASIVEALEAQAAAVRTARHISSGKPRCTPMYPSPMYSSPMYSSPSPVIVSPVTLKPPHNPYATGPAPALLPGELPPQVDPRQMSLLGAGWTAGSLKYLAESGVQSITYYETTGWRGVMETEYGCPMPEVFHSTPGSVFPLYHVLADFGEFSGGEVIHSRSSNALVVDGLSLRKGEKTRVILANFTEESQPVSIQGLGAHAWVRLLDETNAEEALLAPEKFRLSAGVQYPIAGGSLQLTLLPYAVARIDG